MKPLPLATLLFTLAGGCAISAPAERASPVLEETATQEAGDLPPEAHTIADFFAARNFSRGTSEYAMLRAISTDSGNCVLLTSPAADRLISLSQQYGSVEDVQTLLNLLSENQLTGGKTLEQLASPSAGVLADALHRTYKVAFHLRHLLHYPAETDFAQALLSEDFRKQTRRIHSIFTDIYDLKDVYDFIHNDGAKILDALELLGVPHTPADIRSYSYHSLLAPNLFEGYAQMYSSASFRAFYTYVRDNTQIYFFPDGENGMRLAYLVILHTRQGKQIIDSFREAGVTFEDSTLSLVTDLLICKPDFVAASQGRITPERVYAAAKACFDDNKNRPSD